VVIIVVVAAFSVVLAAAVEAVGVVVIAGIGVAVAVVMVPVVAVSSSSFPAFPRLSGGAPGAPFAGIIAARGVGAAAVLGSAVARALVPASQGAGLLPLVLAPIAIGAPNIVVAVAVMVVAIFVVVVVVASTTAAMLRQYCHADNQGCAARGLDDAAPSVDPYQLSLHPLMSPGGDNDGILD